MKHSPHIKILKTADAIPIMNEHISKNPGTSILDVGGRNGTKQYFPFFTGDFHYSILELEKFSSKHKLVIGDACNCPEIPDESIDIYMSHNTLEHVKKPWNMISEACRITKTGGLILIVGPFSWRYHPFPIDYWRFSTEALQFLLQDNIKCDILLKGYDIDLRRRDIRGGKVPGNLDVPPIDKMGGWRENWLSLILVKKL